MIGASRFLSLFILIIISVRAAPAETNRHEAVALNLKGSCAAAGDGVADDTSALLECLNRLADSSLGRRRLYVPAGVYRIGSLVRFPPLPRGVVISGDGSSASVIQLERAFSGDLFSWSEAWAANDFGTNTVNVAHETSGPTVTGLKIVGSRDAVGRQSALTFDDRNDFVLVRDVEIDYVNGPCISIGKILRSPQGYMRESSFYNVKCWNSGSDTEAAVEIGSTSTEVSDSTNELDFYKLAIFAAKNVGLAIRSRDPSASTRKLRFFGLRVEKSGGDGVQIAPTPEKGEVAEVDFYDLSVLTSSGAALRIGGAGGRQPYAIGVHGGLIGPGNKTGIEIDNGRLIDIELSGIDAPVVLGPGAGADISIRGNGSEYDWKYEGVKPPGSVAGPLNLRAPYGLYGLPNAGGNVGASALKASVVSGRPARLTMDGKPADAYNCFNPSYGQAFNLSVQLMAVNHAHPERWYAWTMPQAVFSAWFGPSTATLHTGAAMVREGPSSDKAAVTLEADKRDGCLALTFTPPDADPWDATASIQFARAP